MKKRNERVCIKVDNEKNFNFLWNHLIKIYPNHYNCRDFDNSHHTNYIWINPNDFSFELTHAWNNQYTNWDYKFDTECDMDKIIEFFGIKKSINIMKDHIAIKFGDSKDLFEMVQLFLFSKGFKWQCNLGQTVQKFTEIGNCIYFVINEPRPKEFGRGSNFENYKVYDAATQMGEIIKLFEKPPVPEIYVENDLGEKYKAEFTSDYVQFGCAKIDNNVFKNLYKLIWETLSNTDYKRVENVKIGRAVFSADLIKSIVEHPYFGKNPEE